MNEKWKSQNLLKSEHENDYERNDDVLFLFVLRGLAILSFLLLVGFSGEKVLGEENALNFPEEEFSSMDLVPQGLGSSIWGDLSSVLLSETDPFAASPSTCLVIRGQSTQYWDSVYSGNPTFVAQSNSVAATAPTLAGANGTAVPSSGSTIAPPISSNSGIALSPTAGTAPSTSTGTGFTQPVDKFMRFWSKLSAEVTYTPRGSRSSGLGLFEFDLYSRFSIPCRVLPSSGNGQSGGALFLAPSFSLELWENPTDLWWMYQMPSQTFDAGLDIGFNSQMKDFGVEVWIKLGLASSFKKVNCDSFYIRGRAMGTLGITGDGKFAATAGVIYYDRNRYKLLPSGGVIWKPNPTNVWRLVFPDPRLSRHLGKINETDWWGYLQGNIGGGRWLIDSMGETFNTDYNDYRVGVGVTFETRSSLTGNFEVGGSFAREMYAFGYAWYKPNAAVYLKAGLNY